MQVEDQIRAEMPKLLILCGKLGIAALRARIDADAWPAVTFIGDIGVSRLEGYADRFFGLEDGLTSIFHRRVRLLDSEMERKQQERGRASGGVGTSEIELLCAS